MVNRVNLAIIFIIFVCVITIGVPNAKADVLTLDTDKHTFYVAGDTITFSGTTDTVYDLVVITIHTPPDSEGETNLVAALSTIAGSDMKFEDSLKLDKAKFTIHGIYSATGFTEQGQSYEEGIKIFFDFSKDGSLVIPSAHPIPVELKPINDLSINELTTLTFTATLVESYRGTETLSFSLGNNSPSGATIDSKSGVFSWNPTEAQGPGSYTFDIIVKAGKAQDSESLTITVNEVADAPNTTTKPPVEPEPEPKQNVPNFIDPKKGAKYYLDRYNNEPAYKEWFDKNYPDYTIEEAIELAIPGTVSEQKPPKNLAPFVDPEEDPQYYINRYNNEPDYKAWFDNSFPNQTIYDAVGVDPPKTGICGTGTTLVKGVCVKDKQGGGCLIATAAYGSEMSQQVQILREMRDNTILETESGNSFMGVFNSIYYSFSPTIADWERESPMFKNIVKIAITPLLSSLSILNAAEIDSEEEMLGYGIGIIILNLGMYLVAPTFAVVKAKKYLIKKD
ncbi:MAG TPA: Ig domain-containing protein [Nitrosopumilaceae archaeon]|nr:Ig domain-containing protein [Nitrosopumilaceae archaeon]